MEQGAGGWDGEAGEAAGAAGHVRMMAEQVVREEPRELKEAPGRKKRLLRGAQFDELIFSFFFLGEGLE